MISNKDNEQNNFLGLPFDKWNSGINLLVIGIGIGFVAIILMVVIAVRCRTKRIKKKSSISEEDGYSVSSGSLKPNIINIKKTLSDDNSESSDDVLFDSKRKYIVDRVQPKRTSLPSVSSLGSDSGSVSDSVPSVVVSVVTEGKSVSVTIIKAKNLRRSGYSSTDKLIPEGVFARIYPKTRAMSTDSSQTDGEHHIPEENDYFVTSLVKSKKSKLIKFDSNQTFRISADCFPLRISVYESDKQKVRYNIGHTFLAINTRDNYHNNQIMELDLFSTVYTARQSYLNEE